MSVDASQGGKHFSSHPVKVNMCAGLAALFAVCPGRKRLSACAQHGVALRCFLTQALSETAGDGGARSVTHVQCVYSADKGLQSSGLANKCFFSVYRNSKGNNLWVGYNSEYTRDTELHKLQKSIAELQQTGWKILVCCMVQKFTWPHTGFINPKFSSG